MIEPKKLNEAEKDTGRLQFKVCFAPLGKHSKARFKRRILHAPNRIAKLTACKMRRLNQLNATHFNSMRVSRIFD